MGALKTKGGTMGNFISDMLGRSPVEPLQKHIKTAYDAAALLPSLFVAANLNDWVKVDEITNAIRQLENDADDLKNDIRSNLPKSLFMPVPRQDLLELVLVQDKVANLSKQIAGMVRLRKMQIPAPLADMFADFVSRCVDAAKKAKQSVNELDELYETGFRGAEVKVVEKLIAKLDRIETETDNMQADLQEQVYLMEKGLPPVEVMFLYKLIDMLGDVADQAERIGRRLELLWAK
ncbi:TIGR00153 family protein [Marinicella sp. S1101]|uniref:TIGR00153 family protein n=1 Tax=Marinicella marina TaxID=2996016 RepID=UPI002260D5D7|nr:TIGR00153 family protein [Marinicella marina]MCX7554290.1 TIGR00153 family protein [Marinicella marina]MDJ1138719.1 TIGR00153 family protein [Marinicella marina]